MPTAEYNRYRLKQWHVATWAACILWLSIALLTNFPLPATPMSAVEPSATPANATAVTLRHIQVAGWPFYWFEQDITPGVVTVTSTVRYSRLLVNLFAIGVVIVSLVYVLQLQQRYSLRQVLKVIFGVAFVLALGKFVYGAAGIWPTYYFVCGIYFLPIPCAAVLYWFRRRKNV